MSPKVSIIAPVYNGEQYIESFIESIIAQDYEEWELILVDDGSSDSTLEIIKEKCILDERIQYYCRDDSYIKGADTCRNIGMNKISGDYFIIFDSDDIVEKFCVKQRVIFMQNNPGLDYAVFPGKSIFITETGEYVESGRVWGKESRIPPIISLLKADYNFGVWNLIFKSETMSSLRWDEKLKIYMDFDFLFNILYNNYKFSFSSQSLTDYGYIQGRKNAITSAFVSKDKYNSTKYLFLKTIECINNNKKYMDSYYYFFLSFYKKIVYSRKIAMYKDYYSFFLEAYKSEPNIRLKMLNRYCCKRLNHDSNIGRKVDILITLLFYPSTIIPKMVNRIKSKN